MVPDIDHWSLDDSILLRASEEFQNKLADLGVEYASRTEVSVLVLKWSASAELIEIHIMK